jgi:hypothetical protein
LIPPNTTEDISIETGTVGINRNDLIVVRYVLDASTGYESITLEVVKGKETSGTAADPEITAGDIRTGSLMAEEGLYRVRIEGISIVAIEPHFVIKENICTEVNNKTGYPDYSKKETLFTVSLGPELNDKPKGVVIEEDGFVFLNYESSFKNLTAEPNSFDIRLSINESVVFVTSETIDKEFYKGTSPLYPVKAGDFVMVQSFSSRIDMCNCVFYPLR